MSDYLWDKTGEPDEDTQRLEELLGEFRHRPRPLELSVDAKRKTPDATGATRFDDRSRLSRPARAAIAAALLLVFAAFAFVALRSRVDGGQVATREPRVQPAHETPRQSGPPQVSASPGEVAAPVVGQQERRDEQPVVKYLPRRAPQRVFTGADVRRRSGGAYVAAAPRSCDDINFTQARDVTVEGATLTPEEQQQAKERLVYALRLTSLKLKEVRKRTREFVAPKTAFDEQN